MDPIAHTFVGAALAAAGLRRRTPLATAVLIMGANAPDIDALSYFDGPYRSLELRRGWTHGVLAIAVLPLLLTGLVLLWDRYVRRRSDPRAAPARAGLLLGLAALAVLTHPTLDWLNNYGLRWLMPFDGRWFYGDAVFIIDPWLWLGLGGVLFVAHSRSVTAYTAWCTFFALGSVLVLANGSVPGLLLWLAGVAAAFATRHLSAAGPHRDRTLEVAARVALGIAAAYVVASALADVAERRGARAALATLGIDGVESVMVAPVPVNPFAGQVVVATADGYYLGEWHWLATPRLSLAATAISRHDDDPAVAAAAQTSEARRFLTWARFPYAEIEAAGGGRVVQFRDARYAARGGGLVGPSVALDASLTVTAVE